MAWRAGARMAGVGLAVAAGCLPAGGPPTGQQLLAGRDDVGVRFQPGPSGDATLLVLRADDDGFAATFGGTLGLYTVSAPDAATGRATATRVINHAASDLRICSPCAPFQMDARGRWLLSRSISPTEPLAAFSLVDPATGVQTDLGSSAVSLSPDGSRLLVGLDGRWTVRDLDDRVQTELAAGQAEFVGQDVYLVSPDKSLFRVRADDPAAPPELVAPDVATFQQLDTARGPLLVLTPSTETEYGQSLHSLFDPATGKVTPMPGETEPAYLPKLLPSPTGRYLLLEWDLGLAPRSALWDRDTDTTQEEAIQPFSLLQRWRPHADELWFMNTSVAPDTGATTLDGVWIWRPGQRPARVLDQALWPASNDARGLTIYAGQLGPSAPFTPDGRFVMTTGRQGLVYLRAADDPTGEPIVLNDPDASIFTSWALPDGRLVVEQFTTYRLHADQLLVDPAARTRQIVSSGGHVVAAGARRVLALLDFVKTAGSGTLTLVDLESGQKTVLGENVHDVAVDTPPSAADRLPPGARVAFLVRNRLASPYDGLWLTTLP